MNNLICGEMMLIQSINKKNLQNFHEMENCFSSVRQMKHASTMSVCDSCTLHLENFDISGNQVTYQKPLACTSYKIPQDRCPLSPASAASSASPSPITPLSSSQHLRQRHHLQPSSPPRHDAPHHLFFQKTFSPVKVQPEPSHPAQANPAASW